LAAVSAVAEEEKKTHEKIPSRLPPIEKTHQAEPVKTSIDEKKNVEIHLATAPLSSIV
jgi:hypothetical protein